MRYLTGFVLVLPGNFAVLLLGLAYTRKIVMDLREFYIMVKLTPKISKATTFPLLSPCCFFQVYAEQPQSSASEAIETMPCGER